MDWDDAKPVKYVRPVLAKFPESYFVKAIAPAVIDEFPELAQESFEFGKRSPSHAFVSAFTDAVPYL